MSSEFTELCEMYGLSPGDPEAIDKLIHFMADPVEEDDTWYFNENADAFDPDDLETEEEDDER
jgi:hypothetical protein|tara:strand:- start:273 stop:461 length:189 start_codon:yes stop_codon:yes gene_type:complete